MATLFTADLQKKRNKSTPGIDRPVSLTSVVFKVLESIIKDAIMEHLEQHKLIEASQHGFLTGSSCFQICWHILRV